MAWSYNSADPDATDKDRVRTLADDTTEQAWSLDDALVLYFLEDDTVIGAAVKTLERMRKRWRLKHPESRTAIGMSTSRSATPFDDLLAKLRGQLAGTRGGIDVRGMSKSESEGFDDESDFRKPLFGIGRDVKP